ncbi:MAG: magnesium/cobalt transporter CorA [Microscillaceae bacterium]|nr:magnesium/cobalt transporter CorA [Microscillaceae bacterium]MDW8461352.1 magnesium/cobalt transporter CorA [Cytophagales bacterium]
MAKKSRNRKNEPASDNIISFNVTHEQRNPVTIHVIDYDHNYYEEKFIDTISDLYEYTDRETTTWINIDGVHDTQLIKKIGRYFSLHPLLQEDIINTDQHPKVDFYENNIFVVLKMLSYDEEKKKIQTEQVSLVLGENYLLCFQEDKEGDVFEGIRQNLRKRTGKLRNSNAAYLFYLLIDTIIDNYFYVLDRIAEDLEVLEERIIEADEQTQNPTRELYDCKRELFAIRKVARPLRDMVAQLVREDSKFLVNTNFYMRDLYDHVIEVIENTESFIDITNNLLDMYLSILSNKTNDVMKILTIISSIFLPLSFIAGVYGMNFDVNKSPHNMPELSWYYGYYFSLSLMAACAIGLLIFFRYKKWI